MLFKFKLLLIKSFKSLYKVKVVSNKRDSKVNSPSIKTLTTKNKINLTFHPDLKNK